jgi:hypothetical protein
MESMPSPQGLPDWSARVLACRIEFQTPLKASEDAGAPVNRLGMASLTVIICETYSLSFAI